MAALAARILAPALLEGDDLEPAALFDHLGGDRGAGDGRGAERDVVAAHHQDVAELDDLARIALHLVDLDHILGGHAVLLAAGADDCEHRSVLVFVSRCSDGSGPASSSRFSCVRGAKMARNKGARNSIAPRHARAYGGEGGNCQGSWPKTRIFPYKAAANGRSQGHVQEHAWARSPTTPSSR